MAAPRLLRLGTALIMEELLRAAEGTPWGRAQRSPQVGSHRTATGPAASRSLTVRSGMPCRTQPSQGEQLLGPVPESVWPRHGVRRLRPVVRQSSSAEDSMGAKLVLCSPYGMNRATLAIGPATPRIFLPTADDEARVWL
jgi:hypothetical protein